MPARTGTPDELTETLKSTSRPPMREDGAADQKRTSVGKKHLQFRPALFDLAEDDNMLPRARRLGRCCFCSPHTCRTQ